MKHLEKFGSDFETGERVLDHAETHVIMRTCHVRVLSLFDFVIGWPHRACLPSQCRLGDNLDFCVLWQATLFSVLQGKVQVYTDIYIRVCVFAVLACVGWQKEFILFSGKLWNERKTFE